MNTQKKVMVSTLAGMVAGLGIGYLFGLRNRPSRYRYEWDEIEDYGDEDDEYFVDEALPEIDDFEVDVDALEEPATLKAER